MDKIGKRRDKYRARIVPAGIITKERIYIWVEKTGRSNYGQADL